MKRMPPHPPFDLRHSALFSGLTVLSIVACSSTDPAPPSADVVGFEVTPRALPSLDLVGSSAPGDVWTFNSDGDPTHYALVGDKGTPNDPADDVTLRGTLSSLATIPGNASFDASNILVFRPDGSGPNEGVVVTHMPGFGYALAVPGVGGPTNIVALERAPCALPSKSQYRPFEIALGTRPDSVRYPGPATFAPPLLTFSAQADATQSWLLDGASCDAQGSLRFTSVSTPYSRETDPQYPVGAPTTGDVIGRLAPSGAILLDYGKGFGGSVSVLEATAHPKDQAEVARLGPLNRQRLFAGYFTSTLVFQPKGAVGSDPSVERTARSTTYWMTLRTTDDHVAAVDLRALTTGELVAPGTTASFDLAPLGAGADGPILGSGGADLLFNAHDNGLTDLWLGGPVLQESGSRTISLVLSGEASERTNLSPFLQAISPATPDGAEVARTLYVAYLTLVPPRSCEAPTLTWPDDLRPTSLARLDRTPPQSVRLIPGAAGIDIQIIDQTGPHSLVAANPPNGVQITSGQTFSVDAPITGYTWRLFCGPDYLWPPGPRQDAQIGGRGYATGEPNGFALAEGTYILEHGPEVEPGQTNAASKHVVVRVCPAGGCN